MASTSFAATSALRSLQATSAAMSQAQTRISTGKKVNQASDDPLAWSISQQLTGSIKSNNTYKTGLTTAATQAKLTVNALGQIDKSLRSLQAAVDDWDVANAASDNTKKAAAVKQIGNIQKDIVDAVRTAKYNGSNWLEKGADFDVASGKNMTITVGAAAADQISGSGGSKGVLEKADIHTTTKSLIDFGSTELTNALATIKTEISTAIGAVANAQASFGAAQEAFQARQTFLSDTNDILSAQVSDLVDADLDEESAKLSALQVRQQLATTALSIINQSQLNILRLFQ